MIVSEDKTWLQMVFSYRSSIFPQTWRRIAFATGLAIVVTFLEKTFNLSHFSLTVTPFTVIGIALGIFLGFRNNVCYSRFWEGRTLWGSLVNNTRSFIRELMMFLQESSPHISSADRETRDGFIRHQTRRLIAYVHGLRHLLRDSDPFPEISQYLSAEELEFLSIQKNVPLGILQRIGLHLRRAWLQGGLSDYHLVALEKTLAEITNVQGGCERIKNTPIPSVYTILIHRVVGFYCFFLPFGLVDTAGVLTPLVVLLVSHAFFGLDAIGGEIEQPFGMDKNDLPLHAISRTIEINLLQLIDEQDLPEPVQASPEGVLY
ncbi:MAG: bestrophin family protein [Planctomycetaceae bacterium]